MDTRPLLDAARRTPHVTRKIAAYHADTLSLVTSTIARDLVVIVGMAQNPFVRRARQALDRAGIAHTYLGYGSYLSAWRMRLAIKMWSGWPTFPHVFVRGTLIGGFDELRAAIADGSLKRQLSAEPS